MVVVGVGHELSLCTSIIVVAAVGLPPQARELSTVNSFRQHRLWRMHGIRHDLILLLLLHTRNGPLLLSAAARSGGGGGRALLAATALRGVDRDRDEVPIAAADCGASGGRRMALVESVRLRCKRAEPVETNARKCCGAALILQAGPSPERGRGPPCS